MDEELQTELRQSRVHATAQLVDHLIKHNIAPPSFVSASGIGYYPDSSSTVLHEEHPPGNDFLGQLAKDWEAASAKITTTGTRWCAARLAMVLDPQEGALVPLLRQFNLFAGGVVGDGKCIGAGLSVTMLLRQSFGLR